MMALCGRKTDTNLFEPTLLSILIKEQADDDACQVAPRDKTAWDYWRDLVQGDRAHNGKYYRPFAR
jgi:hypothetical protein